jgi:hypothetical protein
MADTLSPVDGIAQRGFGASKLSHIERYARFAKLAAAERDRLHAVAELVHRSNVSNRRFGFHLYKRVFVGGEAISTLVEKGGAASRAAALADLTALFDAGYFHHPHDAHEMKDSYLFYRFASACFVETSGGASSARSVASLAPSALMAGWIGVGGRGWSWSERRLLRAPLVGRASVLRFAVLVAPREEAVDVDAGESTLEGNLFIYTHDLSSAPLCSVAIDARCACSVSYCATCAPGEFGFTVASARFGADRTGTSALCVPLAEAVDDEDAADAEADAQLSSPARAARSKLEAGVITEDEYYHIVSVSASHPAEVSAAAAEAQEEVEMEAARAQEADAAVAAAADDDDIATTELAAAGAAGEAMCGRADGLCGVTTTRTFTAPSAPRQEKWVHALLKKIGARFVEQTSKDGIVNSARSLLEFDAKDAWGAVRKLKEFAGHVLLVVNVASF